MFPLDGARIACELLPQAWWYAATIASLIAGGLFLLITIAGLFFPAAGLVGCGVGLLAPMLLMILLTLRFSAALLQLAARWAVKRFSERAQRRSASLGHGTE